MTRRHTLLAALALGLSLTTLSGCLALGLDGGAAVQCNAATCSGCCDRGGVCHSTDGITLCGTGGRACTACFSAGPGSGPGGGPGGAGGGDSFCTVPVRDAGVFSEPPIATSHQPAPITGGTLVVVDDTLAVASDPDRSGLWLIGLTDSSVRWVALPPGAQPGRAVVRAGQVHVLLRGTTSVAQVDLTSAAVVRVDALSCPEPRGLTVDPSSDELLVACRGGELLRFQPGGLQSITHFKDDLRDVFVDGTQVKLSRFQSAIVNGYTGETLASTFYPPPTPGEVPEVAWRTIPTVLGPLMVHQRASTQSIDTLAAGGPSCSLSGSPYGAPVEPSNVLFSRCGTAVVTSALTLGSPELLTTVRIAEVLPVDVAARPVVLDCAGADCNQGLFVAVAGAAGSGAVYKLHQSGLDNASHCLFALQELSGQFTGVAFTPSGKAVFHDRAGGALVVVVVSGPPIGGLTRIQYASDPVDNEGSRLFHRVPTGGAPVACASCHPEGGEDGHTWLLNGQPRRTQSLQGGVLARAPFHWRGNLPTLDSVMGDTFVQRMGGAAPPLTVVNNLGAWLDTLPPLRMTPSQPDDRLARGRAAFEKASCHGCHSGPQLSNQLVADVGTSGGPYKTPSLLGLHARRPWMHDGCAQTLRQRFDPSCGGDAHGSPEMLTSAELGDLVAYLENL